MLKWSSDGDESSIRERVMGTDKRALASPSRADEETFSLDEHAMQRRDNVCEYYSPYRRLLRLTLTSLLADRPAQRLPPFV